MPPLFRDIPVAWVNIGNPCVYYGDEALLEGYRDPFNRRTYPWDKLTSKQEEELSIVRKIAALRVENPVLRTGAYETLLAEDGAIAFRRFLDDSNKDYFGKEITDGCSQIVLLMNRNSDRRTFEVCYNKVAVTECEKDLVKADDYIINGDKDKSLKVTLEGNSFLFIIYKKSKNDEFLCF